MVKVKVMIPATITPMALGLEGAEYIGKPGTVIEMPPEAAKRLMAMHAPGTIVLLDSSSDHSEKGKRHAK